MSRIVDKIKRIFGFQSRIEKMVQPSSVIMNAGTQVLKAVKPHTPMIRFRAGSGVGLGGHVPAQSSAVSSSQPSLGTPKSKDPTDVGVSSSVAVEDWQLPSRYRRRPISQEEVDYINRGGPQ